MTNPHADPIVAPSHLLHGLFETVALRRPDHPAVACRGRVLSYGELDRLANRFARYFRARGMGPGKLVALHLEKCVELFAALLGVLKCGAGYVPIDPKFPAERIRSIVEDGRIQLSVSQDSLAIDLTEAETFLVGRDLEKLAAMSDTALTA